MVLKEEVVVLSGSSGEAARRDESQRKKIHYAGTPKGQKRGGSTGGWVKVGWLPSGQVAGKRDGGSRNSTKSPLCVPGS